MKIMALPDLHLRIQKPKNRKDQDFYSSVVLKKLQWIQDFATENGINYVIQPGDFFDSAEVPKRIIGDVIKILYPNTFAKIDWFVVPGQHDLVNHSPNLSNTPIRLLEEAKVVRILKKDEAVWLSDEVSLQGTGWGEEIPEPSEDAAINILTLHKMIVNEEKEWDAQEGHTWALQLLRNSGFDYIISGDNHRSFHIRNRSKYLINCGTLIRNKIDMKEYKPCVYVIDTEKKEVKKHYVPINTDVFQEVETEVEKLAETLKTSFEVSLSYRENVFKRMEEQEIDELTRSYILKAMEVEDGEEYRGNVPEVSGSGRGDQSSRTKRPSLNRRKKRFSQDLER